MILNLSNGNGSNGRDCSIKAKKNDFKMRGVLPYSLSQKLRNQL
ncbi:hypothetical protein ERO13_A11G101450v2 [Gossypium hirsutum]|uniref:Uncharacterized protein n=1 Tax=Gossypium darwinii TaxID=34276 RepID=A0A5D2EJ21_GOSDA|nr:hypothetical protein ERO13_A11G101450v2 [Gossypium hirsutum]TYG93513.1 hypothetical protein ES288_A11G116600v1 [Gossypium darwinii]